MRGVRPPEPTPPTVASDLRGSGPCTAPMHPTLTPSRRDLSRSALVAAVAAATVSSCSVEKYLTADNPIYTGATVELVNPETVPDETALTTALTNQIDVDATNERAAYWWFRYGPDSTSADTVKGLKRRLRNMLGEEPVYYDEAPFVRTELVMRDYLKDHGYFGADVEFDTLRPDPYRVEGVFRIKTEGRSRIDSLVLPPDSTAFAEFVRRHREGTRIKQGDYYTIAALGAERVRLDQLASREGYFELAPSNIFYYVDSTAGPDRVRVWMQFDRGSDSLALERFRIGETFVYPEYTLGDTLPRNPDTVHFEHVAIIESQDPSVHPEVLARRIGLRQGDLYDRRIYENTVNQLLDLGVFKYVNYRFERRLTDSIPVIDQYIYLTQSLSRDINVDLEAASQAGSQLGLGAQVRYADRNFFGGAEDFSISVGAAAGPQPKLTAPDSTVLGQEYTFDTQLALPRLIAPFANSLERRAYYIPRTVANLRYQLTNRTDFTLSNAGLRLGYVYRANKLTTHSLYPVSMSYTSLVGQDARFDEVLADNPRLRQSFADNAILGGEYKFNYNEQSVANDRSFWFLDGGIRTSGGISSVFAQEGQDGGPRQLAGVDLSQFVKGYLDGRRTIVLSPTQRVATRAYVGAALPYGQSRFIPFIEQFFAGGPNSIRAFPIRGLGPGRQLPPSLNPDNVNQSGDIRLELNAEYRFPIWTFLEGATFVDAGNVWLVEDVSGEEPDGVFEFGEFAKQIAVGAGVGLRLNFDVIVVRLDGAVPIRKPWEGGRFDLGPLNVFQAQADEDKLRLHIAIGYPF